MLIEILLILSLLFVCVPILVGYAIRYGGEDEPDRIPGPIAQQLEGTPRIGDVVAFVMSVTVLGYAIIDAVIGVFL